MTGAVLPEDLFDISIVGAGPTGAALALAAAKAGFSTLLIDARPTDSPPRPDGRNYAIVRGSWQLLDALAVAPELEAKAQALNGLEAVEGGKHWFGAPAALFTREDLTETPDKVPLGYMVEATNLQGALDRKLATTPGLTWLQGETFRALTHESGHAIVTLSSGQTLATRLIAGADGVKSSVRAALGITVETRSYHRSVFAANVALSRPHGGIARQLFTPEGPFATLPLPGERANLAWYLPTKAVTALMDQSEAAINAELNHRFATFAGEMTLETSPITYPLILQLAHTMIAQRGVLIGDAARRVNPLAGQGLNLGFKDVAALIDVLNAARHVGLDIGAAATLERYQVERRFDGNATALALDGIDRIFSNANPVLRPLRGAALSLSGRIAPLRGLLARQASADQNSLPRLMRRHDL